jgi:hypothetical protein
MKQSESTKKLLSGIMGNGEKSIVKLCFNSWHEWSVETTAEMLEEERRLESQARIQNMRMEITEKLDGMKYKMTQYVLRAFKKRVMLAHLNYWRGAILMFRQEKMIAEFGEEAASAKSRLQRQRELDAERAWAAKAEMAANMGMGGDKNKKRVTFAAWRKAYLDMMKAEVAKIEKERLQLEAGKKGFGTGYLKAKSSKKLLHDMMDAWNEAVAMTQANKQDLGITKARDATLQKTAKAMFLRSQEQAAKLVMFEWSEVVHEIRRGENEADMMLTEEERLAVERARMHDDRLATARLMFNQKSEMGQQMLVAHCYRQWHKIAKSVREERRRELYLGNARKLLHGKLAAHEEELKELVWRNFKEALPVGQEPWAIQCRVRSRDIERAQLLEILRPLKFELDAQKTKYLAQKRTAKEAEARQEDWVKKEKQMAELNTVMREQVRVMQNEKDKLEREVKNAKGALEEKSQEKRSLMTALEHVHSETQNQEYGLLRSAIQNSLYLKSKPGLIPGLADPGDLPAHGGPMLGEPVRAERVGDFDMNISVKPMVKGRIG